MLHDFASSFVKLPTFIFWTYEFGSGVIKIGNNEINCITHVFFLLFLQGGAKAAPLASICLGVIFLQGSVVTRLRIGVIFNDDIITNLLLCDTAVNL